MDMSKEQFFSHNQVKSEYNIVLGGFTKRERLGRYVPDGMLLTNVIANLSCQPDGAFISLESLRDGLVKLANGKKDGCLEIVGRPDMVLEVVSDGSVKKDLETLRDLYWRAGINEYWIVDARGERLMFEILRRNGTGYVSSRKKAGWVFSEVFGRSFKLIRQTDELGDLEFILEVK